MIGDGEELELGVARCGWSTPQRATSLVELDIPAAAAGARRVPVGYAFPDVSAHRPVSDWAAFAGSYPAAACKATEGRTFVDPSWRGFLAACRERGVLPVAYHFLRAETNIMEQARNFLNALDRGSCGVMLDVETSGAGTDPTVAQAAAWVDVVCNLTGKSRGQVLVYLPRWWWRAHGAGSSALAGAMLANSDYRASPDLSPFAGFAGVSVIQFSSTMRIAGVAEPGDMNIALGMSAEAFATALGCAPVDPPTVPVPPDSIPEVDVTPEQLRAVLNEGTGSGQADWAGTARETLSVIQRAYNAAAHAANTVDQVAAEVAEVRRAVGAPGEPEPVTPGRVVDWIADVSDVGVLAEVIASAGRRCGELIGDARGVATGA